MENLVAIGRHEISKMLVAVACRPLGWGTADP